MRAIGLDKSLKICTASQIAGAFDTLCSQMKAPGKAEDMQPAPLEQMQICKPANLQHLSLFHLSSVRISHTMASSMAVTHG